MKYKIILLNLLILFLFGCSNKEAFDMSREEIIAREAIKINGDKHNSLYDAMVIKEIYHIING